MVEKSRFRANLFFLMPDYEDEKKFSLMHTIESFTMSLTVIRVDF